MIGARFLAEFTLSGQSEILRYAQDDSERARNDRLAFFGILSRWHVPVPQTRDRRYLRR